MRVAHVDEAQIVDRDVHHSPARIERHRHPVVRAARSGERRPGFAALTEARLRVLLRPPGLRVQCCPVHLGIGFGREELTGGAIEDVEEAVLGRLHQHLTRLAVDLQIGEHDLLHGRIVPTLSGGFLEMPDVFARVGTHGNDRSDEQVVATAGATHRAVPRRAVVRSEVQQVELGVVSHRVPDGSAPAHLPGSRIPRRTRFALQHLVGRRAIGLARLARHRVEAPDLLAGLGLIGADEAARLVLRPGAADDDFALHDTRRARDRVRL